jgi:branched-chain amino acid transport system ATP-binding protein
MALLEVNNVSVYYETAQVLRGVSVQVEKGEIVGVVGPNGAGKSTLLKLIAGLIRWEKEKLRGTRAGDITIEGTVSFAGEAIQNLQATEMIKKGLVLCPERRRPFREMTALENLRVAAYLCNDKREFKRNLERVFQLFPRLKERQNQVAGTLSGGEQQMLNIGRALMSKLKLLLIDEPTLGLAPSLVEIISEALREIYNSGVTILLVEQDISFAFSLANRNYLLSAGVIIKEGTANALMQDEVVRKTFLGV